MKCNGLQENEKAKGIQVATLQEELSKTKMMLDQINNELQDTKTSLKAAISDRDSAKVLDDLMCVHTLLSSV